MYVQPLSAIIDSHSIMHRTFADDLQLHMSMLLHSIQSCIGDVKAWATANLLKLIDNKTELMHVTSRRTKHFHNLPNSITIGNVQIPFKQSVKNLYSPLYCHLTMNAHVSNIARKCYFELCLWLLFVDSRQVLQLPHLYLLLLCQELTTVTHCCMVLLMM